MLTVAMARTIEKHGRRATMLWTACATTVLFIIFIALVAAGTSKAAQWASVGVLFVIVFIMTYGWQATKFLYSSEIAPLEHRHIGGAFFSSGEWLMVFITVFASPIGLDNCGWSFWIFILTGNVCAVIFVWLFCPETAGKTLEQGKNIPPLDHRNNALNHITVDYLFVDKTFFGLQKHGEVNVDDVEKELAKVRVEAIEDVGK